MTDNNTDREFLYDENVGLPTFLGILNRLEDVLIDNSAIGMLYVDISKIQHIEETYGSGVFEKVMAGIADILKEMKGKVIRNDDIIAIGEPQGTSFMIFLSERRKEKDSVLLTQEDVETVSDRVQTYLFSKLFYAVYPYLKGRPEIAVGYSFIVNNPLIKPRRLLYTLLNEAKTIAQLQYNRQRVKNKEKLQRIILDENIDTFYQPIVNLKDYSVIGYEALTRGPKETEFETPAMLFSQAEESGLLFELDRVCRKKALLNAKNFERGKKLFINTLPTTINDPEFRGNYLKTLLTSVGIEASDIVFEITEGSAIDNYAVFREAVEYYSNMGISIAIDDMGTGYSNLESIIEIKPHYLKIDISMVKEIHKSLLKKEMLRAIMVLAKNMNSTILAEGIETKEELETLKELGVDLGQGFLFARPGPPYPQVSIP